MNGRVATVKPLFLSDSDVSLEGSVKMVPASRANQQIATRWYVATTQPRKERIAEINLAQQSFRTFSPFMLRTRRFGRRVEQFRAPVFPGYIFVAIDPERDRWRAINGTLGVRHLMLGDRQLPIPMPVEAMDDLFARCNGAQMIDLCRGLEPGSGVRIVNGPFADRLASLESIDERGRIRVLLDILGSTKSVMLKRAEVEPAL